LGEKVKWVHISSDNYGGIGKEKGREAFTKCFKVFLDEANYPIVFHCIAGADRTGSLACILNGLLGVEAELLHKDWQYTWSKRGKEVPEERWEKLMKVFSEYEGATLNEKIEKFVLSNGFTVEDIEKFRSLML
jgi:protein-tyrosine phosphatase